MKLTKRRRVLAWAFGAIVLISGYVLLRYTSAQANKPVIETVRVERASVESTVSASGVLEPLTTVDLKSEAGGRVESLAVDVGDLVKAGQLIAEIDPTDSLTALDQAKADLSAADARLSQSRESLVLQSEQSESAIRQAEESYRQAKSRLAQAEIQAKAQPALTQSAIRQAEANHVSAQESLRQLRSAGAPLGTAQAKASYDQAKATVDTASRNLERYKGLLEKGFASPNQVEAAELEYKTAKAQYDSADERLKTVSQDYDSQIKAAEARVDQTKAGLDNARANAAQDKIKVEEAVAARAALKSAEAALDAAKSNKRQVPIKAADIRASQATVVRSQAELDNARTQLDYTTIRAPRTGIVLQKYVEVGTIITSGRSSFAGTGEGTSIVQLGDCSRMFVLASVDETDIAQVKVGQSVQITLDAYPEQRFKGLVTKIDPQTVVEQNVTTVPVTVEIEKPGDHLKPGMNATCDFIVRKKANALSLPSEAITEAQGRHTVTLIRQGEQLERQIEVGIVGDERTEIVAGLRQGDEVLLSVKTDGQQSTGGSGRSQSGGPPPGAMMAPPTGGRGR